MAKVIDVPGQGLVEFPDNMSDDQIAAAIKANMPAAAPQMTRADFLKRELLRSPPVAIARGLKDIVDTGAEYLAAGYDKLRGPTQSSLIAGGEADRVRAMNQAGRAEFDEATKGEVLPQVARVGGNLAVTVPAVNALGSAVARVMPRLGAAIGSGGLTTGAAPVGVGARVADMGIRAAGGAVGGGLSAGMVSPEDAGTGALIGGALPPALMVAGKAGQAVGRVFRGPEQTQQTAQAVQAARDLGLLLPPTQAKATLGNRLLEGVAGKLTTAQNISAKNAPKAPEIVARDLGLPPDVPLSMEAIGTVKKAAGVMYDAVSNAGTVTPGPAYAKALDAIAAPHVQAAKGFPNAKPSPVLQMVDSLRSESFDAASAVAKLKELRAAADDAFKPGGAGADIGRANKAAAKALEDALERHLVAIGEPDLLTQFREARKLYAKASSVEKAFDQAAEALDPKKLAAQLRAGKPLSGDTKKLAQVAAQFETAFKSPSKMGSLPQFSPIDLYGAGGVGGLSALATGDPMAALYGLGLPVVRTAARAAATSPMVQRGLLQAPANHLALPVAEGLLSRSAPLLAIDR